MPTFRNWTLLRYYRSCVTFNVFHNSFSYFSFACLKWQADEPGKISMNLGSSLKTSNFSEQSIVLSFVCKVGEIGTLSCTFQRCMPLVALRSICAKLLGIWKGRILKFIAIENSPLFDNENSRILVPKSFHHFLRKLENLSKKVD